MNLNRSGNAGKNNPAFTCQANISTHILRHTACTRMAEKGMDQRTLQEIMGHQNLALTMKVYNHVDEKRMRDEMDKLDAVRNVSKDIGNDNIGKVFKVS